MEKEGASGNSELKMTHDSYMCTASLVGPKLYQFGVYLMHRYTKQQLYKIQEF